VGQHYTGSLWNRRDIFPVTGYLRFCVAAARVVGGSLAQNNFLDASFLADRETSIRSVRASALASIHPYHSCCVRGVHGCVRVLFDAHR
jgi:hypothetical protein